MSASSQGINFMSGASLKPRRGRSWKRLRRIEIAARLEALFIPDNDIAAHLGITVQALFHIKKCPEYLVKRIELQTGVISTYDNQLVLTAEEQRDALEDLVPLALNTYKNALMNPMSANHFKAAQDILDRNKATSKISRNELSVAPALDTHKENKAAQELLAMLNSESGPDLKVAPLYTPPEPMLTVAESEALVETELEEQAAADALNFGPEFIPPSKDIIQ